MANKLRTSVFYFVMVVLSISTTRLFAQDPTYKYFEIWSVNWDPGRKMGTGDFFNHQVWCYTADRVSDDVQFRFVPADTVGDYYYYYIVDRRNNACLADYDGNTLHIFDGGTYQDRQWLAEPTGTEGIFRLKNRGTGRYIMAPDAGSGAHYMDADPGDRRTAQWWLELKEQGDIGPEFYVVKQELLNLTMDSNNASFVNDNPLFAIQKDVMNNSSVEQTIEVQESKTETVTESWEFSSSITIGVATTWKCGVSFADIGEASTETTVSFESTFSWTNAVEITTTTEYNWIIPVTVPANSSVRVTATVGKNKTDVPFTAVIKTTLGNDSVRVDTVNGIWKGVEYLKGVVKFEDITDVQDEQCDILPSFELFQNYPNPFNPTTTIKFNLPKTSDVTLKIYNILGEEVATLVSDRLNAGSYSYYWDTTNLASGIYLYRLEAEGFVQTKKMILMQ